MLTLLQELKVGDAVEATWEYKPNHKSRKHRGKKAYEEMVVSDHPCTCEVLQIGEHSIVVDYKGDPPYIAEQIEIDLRTGIDDDGRVVKSIRKL